MSDKTHAERINAMARRYQGKRTKDALLVVAISQSFQAARVIDIAKVTGLDHAFVRRILARSGTPKPSAVGTQEDEKLIAEMQAWAIIRGRLT